MTETRLDVARLQVDQVTDIMRGNMDRIMEREGKLENLQGMADKLHSDSQVFQVMMTNWQLHPNDWSLFTEVRDKSEEKSLAGEYEDKAGSFGNSRSLINHSGLSISILTLQKIVCKHVLLLSSQLFLFPFPRIFK